MHAVTALSLLALAGSALAAPAPEYGQGGGRHVVYTTEVYTVVVTANGPPPKTYAPAPPPKPTTVYTTEQPAQPTYAPAPPPPAEPKPEPKPSPAPAPAPPADSGYMGIVSEWRAKLGLKDLEHSAQLESNAYDTCQSGHGQMVHKLNPGTMGQTLAPGEMKDFEHVFVGAWLCEMPNMPGLDGVCAQQSQGWTYGGQTGHAEICTSPSYSKIGCACVEGICGCDFA